MDLKILANQIADIHNKLYQRAVSAVNTALTVRNWWIGAYIIEYEQKGKDRASYGTALLSHLAKEINIKGLSETNLKQCRIFYHTYPHLHEAFAGLQIPDPIRQSLTDEFQNTEYVAITIRQSVTDELQLPAEKILCKLSFTHLAELIKIEDPLKRVFYEIECIRGTWSVRELKRQIATLYFERSGLSKDKEKLSQLVHEKADQLTVAHVLKNPMTFEFLDLPVKDVLEENDIEQALIDNLQNFLLELGNGFCFEARQKRILIDDEYYYADLVFYHRILRCHVVVEIKNDEFKHEHIGQLEVYLQYYKHEMMQEHDREPVGILLCTKSKKTMVKYATIAKENVFVNEYLINLPSREELEKQVMKFINAPS